MKSKMDIIITLILAVAILGINLPCIASGVTTGYYGSITTYDSSGNEKTSFEMGESVYFSVHVEDEYGDNYTGYFYVYIYSNTNHYDEIDYVYLNLNYLGNGSSYFTLNTNYYFEGYYLLQLKDSENGDIVDSQLISITEPEYFATIITYDSSPLSGGNPINIFYFDDTIYFSIEVEDENENPYSNNNVYVYICDFNNDQIDYEVVYLNPNGYGVDYFDINWYYGNYEPGIYTLKARLSSTGDVIGTKDIQIKEPVYSATITTWNAYPGYYTTGEEKNVFNIHDNIYFTVHVEDEEGNPYQTSYYNGVYINLTFEGETLDYTSVSLNYVGNGSDSFYLGYLDEVELGQYTLEARLTNDGEVIGSHNIYIIELDIELDKNEYSPGEAVKVFISITPSNFFPYLNVELTESKTAKIIKTWVNMELDDEGEIMLNYKLGESLNDGIYNVTITDNTDEFLGKISFNVKLYNLIIYSERSTYLIGDHITIYYSLTSLQDGSGIDSAKFEWHVIYPNYESSFGSFNSKNSLDTFEIAIPDDTELGYAQIRIWANETNGKHSDYQTLTVYIGKLNIYLETDRYYYAPGDFVIITVTTEASPDYYYGSESPVDNANIELSFSKQNAKTGKFEQITSYAQANLFTDANGQVEHIMILGDELKEGMYKIEASVTKKGVEIASEDSTKSIFIHVGNRIAQMALELQTDKQYYRPGDTALVNYEIAYMDTGKGVKNAIIDYTIYFESVSNDENVYIGVGRFNSKDANGSFEFVIPDNFNGELELKVTVTNETGGTTTTYETIMVNFAAIILNVNKLEFEPGDTILVDYELSKHSSQIEFYYKVTYNYYEYYYYEENPENLLTEKHFKTTEPKGKFNFSIPEVGAGDNYKITMYALDTLGHYTENYVIITRRSGYTLSTGLDKKEYKPGEYVTVQYEIIPYGNKRLPEYLEFEFYITGNDVARFETDRSNGNFTYKIPDNVNTGDVMFSIVARLPFDGPYLYSLHLLSIKDSEEVTETSEDESTLSPKLIIKKLGVSTFDIILIIIIAIILVVLFVSKRRKRSHDKEGDKGTKSGKLPQPTISSPSIVKPGVKVTPTVVPASTTSTFKPTVQQNQPTLKVQPTVKPEPTSTSSVSRDDYQNAIGWSKEPKEDPYTQEFPKQQYQYNEPPPSYGEQDQFGSDKPQIYDNIHRYQPDYQPTYQPSYQQQYIPPPPQQPFYQQPPIPHQPQTSPYQGFGPIVKRCPSCNNQLRPDMNQCPYCGSRV